MKSKPDEQRPDGKCHLKAEHEREPEQDTSPDNAKRAFPLEQRERGKERQPSEVLRRETLVEYTIVT